MLISLILADVLILAMSHVVTVQNLLGRGSLFGPIGCQVYGSISTFAALVEIWTLSLVSIERAQAIIYPMDMQKRFSSLQVNRYSRDICGHIQLYSVMYIQSRSVTFSQVQSRSVTVSHGQSRSVTVNHGQSRSVIVSHGQSRSVMFTHCQLWSVTVSQ